MTLIPLHFDLTLFSLLCFFAAFASCCAGLFYSKYLENWLQHIGMLAVGLASAMKIMQIYHRGFVSPETGLLAFGIAIFAAGVAWKVWQHRKGWDGVDRRSRERRHHGEARQA
jgi:hypothetical protein